MFSKGLNKYIFAIDVSLILYILISTLLIVYQYTSIDAAYNNIIARFLMLVISIQIIYLQKNYTTPFMEFLHIILPYFYIIYFYYEAPNLNLFHLGDWTQISMESFDNYFLGNSTLIVFSNFMANKTLVQIGYLIQLIAYAAVPALVFISYAKKSEIGKKYGFISYSSLLVFILIMQIFPTNINEYAITYSGIIGGIYELFQIIIYGTTISTINILVGFFIVSALFFITIDKRISLVLSFLWIISSLAGIVLNQYYFSGTILTWIIAPIVFFIMNNLYKRLDKLGIN